MFKRLLFWVTFTCGVFIVLTIGTSSFQSYQATDGGIEVRDCEQTCTWKGFGIFSRKVCTIEVPVFDPIAPPSCYRIDWDIEPDGVMDFQSEEEASEALANIY